MNCSKCYIELTSNNTRQYLLNKKDYICIDCNKVRRRKSSGKFRKINRWKSRAKWINDRCRSKINELDLISLFSEQKELCNLCGTKLEQNSKLCTDHIISRSSGGPTIKSNLQLLCEKCNVGKHSWETIEYINHCKKVIEWSNKYEKEKS